MLGEGFIMIRNVMIFDAHRGRYNVQILYNLLTVILIIITNNQLVFCFFDIFTINNWPVIGHFLTQHDP